jgi:hypothetical protein
MLRTNLGYGQKNAGVCQRRQIPVVRRKVVSDDAIRVKFKAIK